MGRVPGHQIVPAFGVRLCVTCHQERLQTVIKNDRRGYECGLCKDFTLEMEWPEVWGNHLRAGTHARAVQEMATNS